MAQNLNVGVWVPGLTNSDNQSNNSVIEKYCYNDDKTVCGTDGGLYQWAEAMGFKNACNGVSISAASCAETIATGHHQGICPDGWHIPKKEEWNLLATSLGGTYYAGEKMKTTTKWVNTQGSNLSGFSAFPVGVRSDAGGFDYVGYHTIFWVATEYSDVNAYGSDLQNISAVLDVTQYSKKYGFSVRCLKD